MKRYALGTTDEMDEDYQGEQFYTVQDAIENGDWDTIKELAREGDSEAIRALTDAEDDDDDD